jgi:MSHA biogenesis protein MshJ
MKLPPALENLATRFNGFSLRERVLAAGAVLGACLMIWDIALMQPLSARERALTGELKTIQDSMAALNATLESTGASDPTALALSQEQSLQSALAAVNAELESASAGLIPPERMTEVIHDVLSHQKGVRLLSLRNKPVISLAQAAASAAASSDKVATGPYVHPVELTIEGSYLSVLGYLRTLEQLPWRFYWKVLELETTEHPTNRVLIELSTLSMDKEWLGVGQRSVQ